MKSRKENCILVFVLISILVLSVLYINSLDVSTDETLQENPLQRDEFSIAATYTPGEYPSGLTLLDGDILDAGSGGIFDVTGNFTIVSGATAGIAWPSSYKIIIYADNILIAGILDGNGAGWGGGPGGSVGGVYDYGMDGFCEPQSGAGKGSGEYIGFGGGGAAYGDDGKASLAGGLGGVQVLYQLLQLPMILKLEVVVVVVLGEPTLGEVMEGLEVQESILRL